MADGGAPAWTTCSAPQQVDLDQVRLPGAGGPEHDPGIATIACVVSIWQAVAATRQAKHANEQADLARVQAEEAVRAADTAERQLSLALEQWMEHKTDAMRTRNLMAYDTMMSVAIAGRRMGMFAQAIADKLLSDSVDSSGRERLAREVRANWEQLNERTNASWIFTREIGVADLARKIQNLHHMNRAALVLGYKIWMESDRPQTAESARRLGDEMESLSISLQHDLQNWVAGI